MVIDGDESAAASNVAAGMLAPVTEVHYDTDRLLTLNLASASMYPGFLNELGISHRCRGALVVGIDRDQAAIVKRLFELQTSLGLDVNWVDDCRQLEPALSSSIAGGIAAPREAEVDPRMLMEALRNAMKSCEGEMRVGQNVAQIITEGHAAVGVRLDDASVIQANHIIVAAGAWSSSLMGVADVVRPVKGQALRLRGNLPIEHIVRTPEVYLVPRGDELVVGATVEEMGFDTQVTAGGVLALLQAADEVVPGIRELDLVECSAGLRPATPDNAPLLGRGATDNLLIATGHYRNGVLLAPITAEIICELVIKDTTSHDITAFEPGRFNP